MTDTTQPPLPTLSAQTHACVQGLVRARADVEAWTKNLEQALDDDVNATPPRLTPPEAQQVAKTYDVQAPPAPDPKPEVEAEATTEAANQAQLDVQTEVAAKEEESFGKAAAQRQETASKHQPPKEHEGAAPKAAERNSRNHRS